MSVRKEFELSSSSIEYRTIATKRHVCAEIAIGRDGCVAKIHAEAERVGPIQAVCAAIDRALENWFEPGEFALFGYSTSAVLGEVETGSWVRVHARNRNASCIASAEACHPDIVKAMAIGYVKAINNLITVRDALAEQTPVHAA